MSDPAKGLPGWAVPAMLGGVVLLALAKSQSSGSTGGQVGNVTTLTPTPVDPGVVAISASENATRQSIITSLINMFGSESISTIAANRDVAISGINASVANQRTAASEAVGLAQTDAQTKVSLAQVAGAATIANTNAAAATSQAHIAAKVSTGKIISDGITNVAKGIAHLFGF